MDRLQRGNVDHWEYSYPHSHETVLQPNPGQEEDEGLTATENGTGIACGDAVEGQEVQVAREAP